MNGSIVLEALTCYKPTFFNPAIDFALNLDHKGWT